MLIALCIAIAMMFITKQRKRFWNDTGVVWTTEYHISYETSKHLDDSINAILTAVDNCASPYNKNSLITKINNNNTNRVDSLFTKLYNTSVKINKLTNGAFDPTVMPLVNAWGFGYKTGDFPTQDQIDSILTFTGINRTNLSNDTIIKTNARTQFDFSSIAKGLACDEIARMLKRNGAKNFVIEIGGEVVACGVNSRGMPWHISIDSPADEDSVVAHKALMILEIKNGAVATSGNYRKFKMVNGQKVSHIINPITGLSSASNLLSVTVVASDCMHADAWATACMVIGTEAVKQLAQSQPQLGIMTVSADSNGNYVVWSNETFSQHVITISQ